MLDRLTPYDELEMAQLEETRRWIASGAPLYRTQKPNIPPKHLVSYAVPFDEKAREILLVDHRSAELWLPPGGHIELGEEPQGCAKRELFEELGIKAPLLFKKPFFLTVTETVGNSVKHTDVSLWFVFRVEKNSSFTLCNREFSGAKWFPLTSLPTDRCAPHLPRFSQKLQEIYALT